MSSIAKKYFIPDIPIPGNKSGIFTGKYIKHLGEIVKPVVDASIHISDNEIPVYGNKIAGIIMFIDIGGFTERSGNFTPIQTAYWVNRFLKNIWPYCEKMHATLDKIIGDCLMLILSKDLGCDDPYLSSLEIAKNILQNDTYGYYPHIGIADGDFWLGFTGPPQFMSISAFGDVVNFASRLASEAESNSFAVSKNIKDLVGEKFEIGNDFETRYGDKFIKDFKEAQYVIFKRIATWYPQGDID